MYKKKRDVLIPMTIAAATRLAFMGLGEVVPGISDAIQAGIHAPIQHGFEFCVSTNDFHRFPIP